MLQRATTTAVGLFLITLIVAPTAYAQTGNAVLKRCADEGTTYDKTKCRQANVGKVFSFQGAVYDIKDASTLTIRITAGNYADVVFRSNVGDRTKKDQVLSFHGRLARIGTGIVVNHDIDDAYLDGESSVRGETVNPRFGPSDCKTTYQGWIFNELLEETCGFKAGVARKAGIFAKGVCKDITEIQQREYAIPVMVALKEDWEKMSRAEFCRQNRAGYEALVK